jgi:hypothetical protein
LLYGAARVKGLLSLLLVGDGVWMGAVVVEGLINVSYLGILGKPQAQVVVLGVFK